jgi:hypothetical protein
MDLLVEKKLKDELDIHMMMSKTKEIDNTKLEKLRERDYNVLQKIKTAQKRLSEMKRNVTSMSQIVFFSKVLSHFSFWSV